MKRDGIVVISFLMMLLLSPPGIGQDKKGIFDSKQFTRQIRLEMKVAKVTKHPLLIRGPLDYLAEGGKAFSDTNSDLLLCKENPSLTDRDALADMAREVASAPDGQVKKLKTTYYCYRFDILSYFIATHQNEALRRALDAGFDEYFITVKTPGPYEILYLLNQTVFAENKEALRMVAERGGQYLYLALLNFIPQKDEAVVDWPVEIKKREHKYRHRKVGSNDLVHAILHNSQYDLAAAKEFIPQKSRQAEYFKALNSLIDIRIRSK